MLNKEDNKDEMRVLLQMCQEHGVSARGGAMLRVFLRVLASLSQWHGKLIAWRASCAKLCSAILGP